MGVRSGRRLLARGSRCDYNEQANFSSRPCMIPPIPTRLILSRRHRHRRTGRLAGRCGGIASRAGAVRCVSALVSPAALCLFRQRANRSARRALFLHRRRSFRLAHRLARRCRGVEATCRSGCIAGPRPRCPICRRSKAARLGYSRTICRAASNVCRGPNSTSFKCPGLAIGLYDVVVAFDHLTRPGVDHLARFSGAGTAEAAAPSRRAGRTISAMLGFR